MVELWASLSALGFSNYEASSLGRISNVITGHVLNPTSQRNYLRVSITNDLKNRHSMSVHRLVAAAFYGVNENLSVDHINRNTLDNTLLNLRYATSKEQIQNTSRSLIVPGKKICQYDLNGNFIKIWDRILDASVNLNLDKRAICAVCKGKRDSVGGFIWRYHVEIYASEEWRTSQYPELENFYVSNYGRIYKSDGTITKGYKKNGYLVLGVYENNSTHHVKRYIHRLVAASFFGRNDDLEVNHKDGDKLNNNVDNLEYVTRSQNIQHAVRTGLRKTRKVIQYDLNNNYIASFDSIKDAISKTAVTRSSITDTCNGRHKNGGGFIWRYAE